MADMVRWGRRRGRRREESMSREGISSFLLDCHTNESLAEIEAEYGAKGFAVVVRLWQKIYSEKGYYCEWNDRSPLLFLATWFGGNSGVDLNLINEVVSSALRVGIFDGGLYERYSILTSEGIQRRYFDVVRRRAELTVVEEYLLVSVGNFRGIVCKKSVSADKNGKIASNSATSKGKGSKAKQREGKEPSAAPRGVGRGDDALIEARGFPPGLEGAVKEWAAYKAERRQGYKETGLRNLLSQIDRKAAECGADAVEGAIRESMANNWQGIVWDRVRPSPRAGAGQAHMERFAESARRWAGDD